MRAISFPGEEVWYRLDGDTLLSATEVYVNFGNIIEGTQKIMVSMVHMKSRLWTFSKSIVSQIVPMCQCDRQPRTLTSDLGEGAVV